MTVDSITVLPLETTSLIDLRAIVTTTVTKISTVLLFMGPDNKQIDDLKVDLLANHEPTEMYGNPQQIARMYFTGLALVRRLRS